MATMARPSFTIPDELLEEFDDVIWELQRSGHLGRDANRSKIVRQLIMEWNDEQKPKLTEEQLAEIEEYQPEGNPKTATTAPTAD